MDRSKNVRWIIPFKKFGMARVNIQAKMEYIYTARILVLKSWSFIPELDGMQTLQRDLKPAYLFMDGRGHHLPWLTITITKYHVVKWLYTFNLWMIVLSLTFEASVAECYSTMTSNKVPLTAVGSNPVMNSFMWGSWTASLPASGVSTRVPLYAHLIFPPVKAGKVAIWPWQCQGD